MQWRALSIRQPWASLIIAGDKTIENRTWRTSYRGPVLIHAGRTREDVNLAWLRRRGITAVPEDVPTGGIIGVVEIADCLTQSSSAWFTGPYGWLLRDPRPLPFIPERGRLGLFCPTEAALDQLEHVRRGAPALFVA